MPGRLLIAVLILAAIAIAVIALMWFGWRRKRRDQRHLPAPLPLDAEAFGEPDIAIEAVHYVATTPHDAPLERIVAGGLGFRGRARIATGRPGVAVAIEGRTPFLIPWSSIRSIEAGTATIDRVVEQGGLTVIRWDLAAHAATRPDAAPVIVDTSFRIVDPAERDALDESLERGLPAHAPTPEEHA